MKLAIYQEVSSIFNAQNPSGIILNKRSLESQVLVDDGQIIVLGGLISDDVQTGTQSVPVLGDIPVLGSLFRYDTRKREKINLMVFLRPVVLRDGRRPPALTADRYDVIRGIQGRSQPPDQFPLPPMHGPQLPRQLPPLVPGRAGAAAAPRARARAPPATSRRTQRHHQMDGTQDPTTVFAAAARQRLRPDAALSLRQGEGRDRGAPARRRGRALGAARRHRRARSARRDACSGRRCAR